MSELRLGDVIDDFCVKCRRVTNHSIVSIVGGATAKVRCRTCYHDHDYRREQAPPSKKDLKKAELFAEVLSSVAPAPPASLAGSGDGRRADADPVEADPVAAEPQEAKKKARKASKK